MELMTGADEDEGGEKDIDDRIVGNEDQDPAGVRTQKYVILRYQHLDVESSDPGKEAGVVGAHKASHVPQNCEANYRQEGDVGVNFVTIHFVPVK